MNGKFHYKWPFSIVMLVYQKVKGLKSRLQASHPLIMPLQSFIFTAKHGDFKWSDHRIWAKNYNFSTYNTLQYPTIIRSESHPLFAWYFDDVGCTLPQHDRPHAWVCPLVFTLPSKLNGNDLRYLRYPSILYFASEKSKSLVAPWLI